MSTVNHVITAYKPSCGKLMFYKCLCVHKGWSLPPWTIPPPRTMTPERYPLPGTYPLPRTIPHQDHIPSPRTTKVGGTHCPREPSPWNPTSLALYPPSDTIPHEACLGTYPRDHTLPRNHQSGRCASYWNALLLSVLLSNEITNSNF